VAPPSYEEIAAERQLMRISAQTGLASNNSFLEDTDVSTKRSRGSQPGYKNYQHEGGVLPSARGCGGTQGPYIVGSFIYWRASFDDFTDVGVVSPIADNENKINLKNPHYPYAPGLKLGIGYNFPSDAWDLFLNWTYLKTRPRLTLNAISNNAIVPALELNGINPPPFSAEGSKSKGHIKIDVGDLEIGRNFFAGSFLALRPFGGAKAIWFDTFYKTTFSGTSGTGTTPSTISDAQDSFKTKILGIGPRLGINTRWSLGTSYAAFLFNTSGSLMWENTRTTLKGSYIENGLHQGGIAKIHPRTIHPLLEVFAGIDFGGCIGDSDVAIYFSAGWEAQWWFHQIPNTFVLPSQSLNLQGLTTSLRLDF
jgi:hypothetical protein